MGQGEGDMATAARQRRVSEEEDDTDPGLTDPFLQVFISPTSSLGKKQETTMFFKDEGDSIAAVNGHIKQVFITQTIFIRIKLHNIPYLFRYSLILIIVYWHFLCFCYISMLVLILQ